MATAPKSRPAGDKSLKQTPADGKEIWELGLEKNLADLDKFLTDTGVESLSVVDVESEERLARVRREIDASKNPKDARGIVLVMTSVAGTDGGHELLKRVLALGAHPDLRGSRQETPSHLANINLRVRCAEAVAVCRPDLEARTNEGYTPLNYASFPVKKEDPEKLSAKTRISEIWNDIQRNGFPNIARLAYQKDFWAVKNLCRRRLIEKAEVMRRHNSKNVFQWAEHHGEHQLVEELNYLLTPDDVPHSIDQAQPTVSTLLKDVRLLTTRLAALEAKFPVKGSAAAAPAPPAVDDVAETNKTLAEFKEFMALSKSSAEEKFAEIRSSLEDQEKAISSRFQTFREDQDSKIRELMVAFGDLAAELRDVQEKIQALEEAAERQNAEDRSKPVDESGGRDDLLQMVISSLLAKIGGMAASGATFDLVEDLVGVVRKLEARQQTTNIS